MNQTDRAIEYIKQHAKDDKPFFMDVNFMKMHNPNNPDEEVRGQVATRAVLGFDAGTR